MDNTKFKKQVYEALKNIKDINSDTNIVDNKTLHEVVIDDNQINLILNIKGNSPNYYNKIQELCKKYVKEINNKISINIILTSKILCIKIHCCQHCCLFTSIKTAQILFFRML